MLESERSTSHIDTEYVEREVLRCRDTSFASLGLCVSDGVVVVGRRERELCRCKVVGRLDED